MSEMNESQETVGTLVIAGRDTAKFLQFQEESLHQMPFFVKPPVYKPRIRIVTLGRDTKVSAVIGDVLPQLPLSVGLVSQNSHPWPQIHRFQHILRDLHIMYISS